MSGPVRTSPLQLREALGGPAGPKGGVKSITPRGDGTRSNGSSSALGSVSSAGAGRHDDLSGMSGFLSAGPSVFDSKLHRSLFAPLPNLFRATFEQARCQSQGEQWLEQRIRDFDAGNKQKRKEVLGEFLEYIGQSSATSMEELFSNQAHLFFIRLTSWFSITLPMFFELSLQLKVFLVFLEFREQSFIRAFFECGAVVPLMHALSVDFDVQDDVRCLSIMVLHKLAAAGRNFKEMLCAQGIITNILDCASDGLRWETLKFAGRLLCELFHANPRYHNEVLDALQELMGQRLPLTQRVGTQAFISLLVGEGRTFPAILLDPSRHRSLVGRALGLLDSPDLRVGADAYCLLCRLMRCFGCDELLFDFARRQLRSEKDSQGEWLRLEVEAQEPPEGESSVPFAGRHQGTVSRLHERVAEALAGEGGPPTDEGSGGMELIRRVNRSNAEFCNAFKNEAEHILKWGLLVYLAKRNQGLCSELVESGLAETLLMCLLDVSHPVRQAAALAELHRVRLLSTKAAHIVEHVLVKPELTRAMSLDEFMRNASSRDLQRARSRLRNLRIQAEKEQSQAYGAKEHGLQQLLMEKQMADSLGVHPPTAGAFMTEQQPAPDESAPDLHKDVARSGAQRYHVRRVPDPSTGQGYKVDRGQVEEVPFSGNLTSFLADPLDISADEDSPLIQELRHIEASVGLGVLRRSVRTPMAPPPMRAREASKKDSHRPSMEHVRAMALRSMPPKGVEPRRPPRASSSLRSAMQSRAESDLTELSLHMGTAEDPLSSTVARHLQHIHSSSCGCGLHADSVDKKSYKSRHLSSLAETSVGPEATLTVDMSEETSRDRILAAGSLVTGNSVMTSGSGSLEIMPSIEFSDGSMLQLPEAQDANLQLVQKTSITAVSEVQLPLLGSDAGDGEPLQVSVQKRILHVARAPYHDCIAFDKGQVEQDREADAEKVTQLLHPATQRRFQDLKKAGSFPRQWLVGSGTSGALSARLPVKRDLKPATSGSFSQFSADSLDDSEFRFEPGGTWSLMRALDSHNTSTELGSIHGSSQANFSLMPETGACRPMRGMASLASKESLKDYFPASAR